MGQLKEQVRALYKAEGTNMKANSRGSVTPVRKEVSAAESMMPPIAFLWAGFAVFWSGEGYRRQTAVSSTLSTPTRMRTSLPLRA